VNPIGNDFRYSPRGFRRSPLFNALAVLSLAFGIGASTAIFSLIDQVLCSFCRYPEQWFGGRSRQPPAPFPGAGCEGSGWTHHHGTTIAFPAAIR